MVSLLGLWGSLVALWLDGSMVISRRSAEGPVSVSWLAVLKGGELGAESEGSSVGQGRLVGSPSAISRRSDDGLVSVGPGVGFGALVSATILKGWSRRRQDVGVCWR
jgi:hypothetical protein